MLFKKITYQTIRNYELWKKKTQQRQSTNSTKNTLRNLRTEKSKGKESKDKVEVNPKFYVHVILQKKSVYNGQILLCIPKQCCCIPKQWRAELKSWNCIKVSRQSCGRDRSCRLSRQPCGRVPRGLYRQSDWRLQLGVSPFPLATPSSLHPTWPYRHCQ